MCQTCIANIEDWPVLNWLVSSSSCKGTFGLLHFMWSNTMIFAVFLLTPSESSVYLFGGSTLTPLRTPLSDSIFLLNHYVTVAVLLSSVRLFQSVAITDTLSLYTPCMISGTLRLLLCSLVCSSFAIFYAFASIETDVV